MQKTKRKEPRSKRASHFVVFVVFFLFFPYAAHGSGEPDAFTLNGVGARPGGMGNAFIGLSDGLESIYYNPAGLGYLKQSEFTADYEPPMLQTYRTFTAFDKAWDSPVLPGSVAIGWLRLTSDNIELTNTDEQILGTDNLTNDLFMLGVGVNPFEHVAIGATVKYFRFAFDGFHEAGVGYDIGVHAHYGILRLGAALTDLNGTTLTGPSSVPGQPDASDQVPERFRPGVALVFKNPLSIPITFNMLSDEMISLQGPQQTRSSSGFEIWAFNEHAALRGGYQEATGPTVGMGLRIGFFQLDYSYLFNLNLEDESRISTTFRF